MSGLGALGALSLMVTAFAAPQSYAALDCKSDPRIGHLPAGTQFILKKRVTVQEVSHESERFGRRAACSFWVGKPLSQDFQDEIENGITFNPQTFVLNQGQPASGKLSLKTGQGKLVTLYCDENTKITTLSSLRAALGDDFTVSVPAPVNGGR